MWFIRFFIIAIGLALIKMIVTQETIPIRPYEGGLSSTYVLWDHPVAFILYFTAFAVFEWYLVKTYLGMKKEDNSPTNAESEVQRHCQNKNDATLDDTEDQVALKVSWEPAKSGGASFKAQKMTVSPNMITVENTVSAMLFALVFAIPGLLAAFIGIPYFLIKGQWTGVSIMFFLSVFGVVGVSLLKENKKFTFNKSTGVYYQGKEYDTLNVSDRSRQGQLSDIHAIQLLSERCHSHSPRGSCVFTSYEMNLVFKDGERINVMDHGKGNDIYDSAKRLGRMLNVPVWKSDNNRREISIQETF
jgi:hypothetical protein